MVISAGPPHVAKTTDSVSRGLVHTERELPKKWDWQGNSRESRERSREMGPAKPVDVPLKPQAPPPPQTGLVIERLDERTSQDKLNSPPSLILSFPTSSFQAPTQSPSTLPGTTGNLLMNGGRCIRFVSSRKSSPSGDGSCPDRTQSPTFLGSSPPWPRFLWPCPLNLFSERP